MVHINYLNEYVPVVLFIAIAGGLAFIMLALPFLLANRRPYSDKNAPYECGFQPFSQPRNRFNVGFYIVAVLFLIFDLEIVFLFPWAVIIEKLDLIGFISMLVFLFLLLIGFIYEWKSGALEWH